MFVNSYFLITNPFFEAFWDSDLLGKAIFLALFILSIITWILLIEKIQILKKIKLSSKKTYIQVQKQKSNLLNSEISLEPSPFQVLFNSLKNQANELLNKNQKEGGELGEKPYLSLADLDYLEAHLLTKIIFQTKNLEKSIYILSTIVTLAPFLGLLGTVWGILGTFSQLQLQSSGGVQQMALGGLSLALTTTVLGLIDAIPALVGYNWIKVSIDAFDTEMRAFSSEMLAAVEMQYRKVDKS